MVSKAWDKKSYQLGRSEGHAAGYDAGWRNGACEALTHAMVRAPIEKLPMRILYIPQGFEAIDSGIIEALQASIHELLVGESIGITQQAAELRPDLVLVMNGLHVFPDDHLEQMDAVRALGIRTAVWFADDPYMTSETALAAPHYDIVLTHELSTVPLYKELGCANVHYLPLAVNENIFKAIQVGPEYASDICFIGQAFWNRVELFDAIAEQLKGRRVFIAGGMWERLKHYSSLKSFIRLGWVPIEETALFYNGAKIVINMHRTTEAGLDNFNSLQYPGLSINPRTYEIAACATLQLTDVREDLNQYYRPGYEIETFGGAEELASKINYYLSHEEERRQIAMRGYYRTRIDHTFKTRIAALLQLLQPTANV